MYAQQSLHDTLFLMLYGGVAILALVSGLYLWLRRSNAIAPDVTPSTALRRWTAAFFITAALSHVWWYVLGVYWLTDDRLVRNIVAVTLDHVFLVWRVETLEVLDAKETVMPEDIPDTVATDGASANFLSLAIPDNIQELLDQHCEARHLYLRHDLTLQQLATAIGTNRTYLSAYFAQQGITYNAYINRLRVDHFMRLYRDSIKSDNPAVATQLAQKSGFRSYSTFATAFKYFNGLTVTAWMKTQV